MGILDGEALAESIRGELRAEIAELTAEGVQPGLATIHMGTDPAAASYVAMKQRDVAELGMYGEDVHIDPSEPKSTLIAEIERLNQDPAIHGIIVQDDYPEHVDWMRAIAHIDPMKDVDGIHPENVGRLVTGNPRFVAATPLGIQRLLEHEGIDIEGSDVVIVNRSMIVGKPLANLLVQKTDGGNATVTVCHSRTERLKENTKRPDILVIAINAPEFIDETFVTPGTVAVDVGISRVDADTEKGYELTGDVDFERVAPIASAITPVPGGVGPMTRVMLHHNTVKAAKLHHHGEE